MEFERRLHDRFEPRAGDRGQGCSVGHMCVQDCTCVWAVHVNAPMNKESSYLGFVTYDQITVGIDFYEVGGTNVTPMSSVWVD